MQSFNIAVGFSLVKQMLRDKFKQVEERRKLKIERKAVLNERGHITLEDRIELPRFRYKTVAILGAKDVKRRQLLYALVENHPELYGIPTLHTCRPARPHEVTKSKFTFVTHQQMMNDVREDRFLEYGVRKNQFYGMKYDSIRSIIRDGKVALLEILPKSLRYLRNPEFAPFVIFIAPPVLRDAIDFEGRLAEMNNESAQMQRDYAHLIDVTIVMNDVFEAIEAMEVVVDDIMKSPQWVPTSWVQVHR